MKVPCLACKRTASDQVGHTGLRETGEARIGVGTQIVDVTYYACEFCDAEWQAWSTGQWLPV